MNCDTKIKQEVKDLCLKLRYADKNSKEFEDTQNILQTKYGFSAFSLLALFKNPPVIEYEFEQIKLIMDKE